MKSVKLIVKILFIISAFLIIFNKIDLNKLQTIQIHYPSFLFLAFIFFNLSQIISALRVHKYLKNINVTPTLKKQIMLYYVGMFYNTLLPGGIGGDAYKAYKFQKSYNKGYKQIIKALLIDRISGLFGIFFIIGILILFSDFGFIYFSFLIVVSPFLLYFLHKFFFKEFRFFPFVYSLIIQALQGITFLFILLSLNINTHLIDFILLFYISSIISVIPISIGGVGLRELTFLYGLSLLKIDPTIGVVSAFLFFIITIISNLIGIIFLKKVENV